jgi:predicted dehydrogenase
MPRSYIAGFDMTEPWRALVIGCGDIAGGYNDSADDRMVLTHAAAYCRHDNFVLTACVEPSREKRQSFMAKWGVPFGYSTLEDALACSRYDIVSICSPTGTHLAAIRRVLEVGTRAIIVEKPVDENAAGARECAVQARRRGVPIAVNFTRRFDPAMRNLRRQILSSEFGVLLGIVGWYCRGTLNNASHLIDLIIFLTGREPHLVATGPARSDLNEMDISVSAILDLCGVPCHLIPADGRRYSHFELELAFEDRILTIEDGGLAIRQRLPTSSPFFRGIQVADRGTWMSTRYGEALLVLLDDIRAAATTGASLASDLDSASISLEIALAIRGAFRCHEQVQ